MNKPSVSTKDYAGKQVEEEMLRTYAEQERQLSNTANIPILVQTPRGDYMEVGPKTPSSNTVTETITETDFGFVSTYSLDVGDAQIKTVVEKVDYDRAIKEVKRLRDWISSLSPAWLPEGYRDERRLILKANDG